MRAKSIVMYGIENIILWGAIVPALLVCLVLFGLLIHTAVHGKESRRVSPAPTTAAEEKLSLKAWIAMGIAAIAIISVPAQRLFSLDDGSRTADITIEVTGNIWFWTYRYPDRGDYSFSAPMLEDALTGERRLAGLPASYAEEENRIVVPVGKTVRLVTRGDAVIYRWEIPAIGVLVDALPGRPNETWFSASSRGRYSSEYEALCSASHVFIPIEIDVVGEEQFDQWLSERQTVIGSADTPTTLR
jgi:cytochrome c oxidase subunit 2